MGPLQRQGADEIDLGQISASSTARHELLRELVRVARQDLEALMTGEFYLSGDRKWEMWRQLIPLEYESYRHAVGRFDSLRREWRAAKENAWSGDTRPIVELGPEIGRFLEIFDRERHRPNADGYRQYVGDVCDALIAGADRIEATDAKRVLFSEQTRELHTHVLGGRGSGKSELMKLLIHHYVRHPELGAVVVIDPHNDLAHQISQWREFDDDPDRLVYLTGNLSREHIPKLNPLAVGGLDADDRASFAVLMADALGTLSATRGLTDNMRTLATNSLRVVLEEQNPTLASLARLLGSEDNPATRVLAERARQHPDLGEWFSYRFREQSLSASRSGLADRLDALLTLPRLGPMLKSPETLDLEALIEARKVIVIGLAGGDGGNELGRLMLARVAMIGWRRLHDRTIPRTPVHVFVDEAHRLVGPTVLELLQELRKSGMRLTLAHQALSQIENPNMRDTLWAGTGIKILGSSDERDALETLFGKDAPEIPRFQFAIRWGMVGRDSIVMLKQPHAHLRGETNTMSPEAYERLKARQLGRYYVPVARQAAEPPSPRSGTTKFGTMQ